MHREFDHFHEALEQPPAERAAFLQSRHADDPELVRRLLGLLEAHERAEREEVDAGIGSPLADFRALGIAAGHTPVTTIPADEPPTRIGPYQILERLGEGGMGVVYSAEQTAPLRRRVAIKILKLGLDSREVIARFEAERQALAILDHPGIAKVHDAGLTEQGRPFFVMELVEGLPMTRYCATHGLDLRDRLQLFIEVCRAVQHAHHRGIIHRDLKPSNVLVSSLEGSAVPKVIDFGVAKATSWRLTERTLLTEQGRLIGTPEYMSPEQAEGSGTDIDTRTDVYSLGVLLYELLTGALPFESKTLREGGYSEILRIIRDVDPVRPSSRVGHAPRAEDSAHDTTGIESRVLKGELDWIVMRALEKDRTRRYPSADALRDDVECYLAGKPVHAGPPSAIYQARKFVQRHRFAVAATAVAAICTLVGVTGLIVGLVRARGAEALAERRAENAQAAALFLERMVFQSDPETGGDSETTLLDLMAAASRRIPEDLGPFPEVEASVRESLGVAYRRRSMYPEAAPHLTRSLELRRQHLGESHIDTARAYVAMADLRFEYEGAIDEPLTFLERALAIVRSLGAEAANREPWIHLDIGLISLAGDRLAAADRAFTRCRDLLAANRGESHPDIGRAVRGLAGVALGRGHVERALRLAEEAVTICGDERYIATRAKMVLAQARIAAGAYEDASELLDQTAEAYFATVGSKHIRIAERFELLGHFHLRQQQWPEVAEIASQCETLRRQLLRSDHWALLDARLLRLRAAIGRGELDSARRALVEIRKAAARVLPPDHPLGIRIAEALEECAAKEGDEILQQSCARQLNRLRARRAQRLRRD